jgi:hypothetical protein
MSKPHIRSFSLLGRWAPIAAAAALVAACGGGGGSSGSSVLTPSGNVPVVLSDASSEDWAAIGAKVLQIALVPQGGGANVVVYTAASPAPTVNLAQLDSLGELMANASVPAGTYLGALVTIAANPGDVSLVVAPDPEPGFAAAAGSTIDPATIQIQGAQGAAGSRTVPVAVSFASPLVVSASQTTALDLEFDLAHPAFIVGHVPVGLGATLWAVDFNGPLRRHPVGLLPELVLRHLYGSVSAVAADASSVTLARELPSWPPVSPETAVATGQSVTVLADAANGTLFYDLDAKTKTTLTSFASVAASLPGKQLRVAARYQADGTLVATRIWASSSFSTVWFSPEGHVLHVDPVNDDVVVADDTGHAVALTVDANTQFFFRRPDSAASDATPIATGTAFLAAHGIARGFKIHAQVVDPLAVPLVAQTIDIETAVYDGAVTNATSAGFTTTRRFATPADDYSVALGFIAPTSPNGTDPSGNAVSGFEYWNFAFPAGPTTGAGAVGSFVNAVGGSVDFGGLIGALNGHAASFVRWGDSANPNGWSTARSIVMPVPLPRGTVATAYANNAFAMSLAGGANPVTVTVSTTPGSATLVYQVDRTGGILTISAQDITTPAGLAAMTTGLAAGAVVRVDGAPQADGTLKAYVLAYFTGVAPR